MSIGKFSVFEILDCRTNLRFKIAGSGRIREITSYSLTKEMFTDFSFSDIPYELDYARIVPRRLKSHSLYVREWNGSYKDVFV